MGSVNDMTIIYGLITFFIILGIATPLINAEFGSNYSSGNPDSIENDITAHIENSEVSMWQIIKSVLSMFLWTFGALPVWFDLIIMLPLRILLVLIVARNIWIGGGG